MLLRHPDLPNSHAQGEYLIGQVNSSDQPHYFLFLFLLVIMAFVSEQPTLLAQPPMSFTTPCDRADGDANHRYCSRCQHTRGFGILRRFKTRRLIIPILLLFLLIAILVWFDLRGSNGEGIGSKTSFLRRALLEVRDDNDSHFVRHKRAYLPY